MSQLFAAVYEIHSATLGRPFLRLNLVVNRDTDSVVGSAMLETVTGDIHEISVRGHHMEIDGDGALEAIVLAGTPPIFAAADATPTSFQMLMVLPTAWKDGQACYKMSLGKLFPRVIDVSDGVARAVLPEVVY
jgi:citrate lyase gamma subunit